MHFPPPSVSASSVVLSGHSAIHGNTEERGRLLPRPALKSWWRTPTWGPSLDTCWHVQIWILCITKGKQMWKASQHSKPGFSLLLLGCREPSAPGPTSSYTSSKGIFTHSQTPASKAFALQPLLVFQTCCPKSRAAWNTSSGAAFKINEPTTKMWNKTNPTLTF